MNGVSSTASTPDPAKKSTTRSGTNGTGRTDEAPINELAPTSAPAPMKLAAIVAIIQGAIAVGYGAYFAVTQARAGANDELVESDTAAFAFVGVGTFVFILLAFGPMIYGGVNILRGNQWGRSIIVFINALLLGISFFMFSGGAIALGAVTLLSGLLALGCSLHPASIDWATSNFNKRRARQGA